MHHGAKFAAVLQGEIHASGAVIVETELLAHRAHCGSVHERSNLFNLGGIEKRRYT